VKILFLDHDPILGGGQVMAQRLLPALRGRGLSIDALVGCAELDGGPIPRTLRGLRRAMRGYDLVYANTARPAIAAALTARPFLWHKHHGESTRLQRMFVSRRARRVVCVARFGAPKGDNVRVVYNGVPPQEADPAPDLPAGPKILIAGRIDPEKGHDIAARALGYMKRRATLVVAGPGAWFPPPNDRVLLLGLRRDVPALLAGCDVLLSASRCDEGFSLVVAEAQMAGVPVVATRSGGIPEIVREGETAFLVPKEDPVRMARALDNALAVDRTAWSRAARAYAQRFRLDRCADEIAAVIRECL